MSTTIRTTCDRCGATITEQTLEEVPEVVEKPPALAVVVAGETVVVFHDLCPGGKGTCTTTTGNYIAKIAKQSTKGEEPGEPA